MPAAAEDSVAELRARLREAELLADPALYERCQALADEIDQGRRELKSKEAYVAELKQELEERGEELKQSQIAQEHGAACIDALQHRAALYEHQNAANDKQFKKSHHDMCLKLAQAQLEACEALDSVGAKKLEVLALRRDELLATFAIVQAKEDLVASRECRLKVVAQRDLVAEKARRLVHQLSERMEAATHLRKMRDEACKILEAREQELSEERERAEQLRAELEKCQEALRARDQELAETKEALGEARATGSDLQDKLTTTQQLASELKEDLVVAENKSVALHEQLNESHSLATKRDVLIQELQQDLAKMSKEKLSRSESQLTTELEDRLHAAMHKIAVAQEVRARAEAKRQAALSTITATTSAARTNGPKDNRQTRNSRAAARKNTATVDAHESNFASTTRPAEKSDRPSNEASTGSASLEKDMLVVSEGIDEEPMRSPAKPLGTSRASRELRNRKAPLPDPAPSPLAPSVPKTAAQRSSPIETAPLAQGLAPQQPSVPENLALEPSPRARRQTRRSKPVKHAGSTPAAPAVSVVSANMAPWDLLDAASEDDGEDAEPREKDAAIDSCAKEVSAAAQLQNTVSAPTTEALAPATASPEAEAKEVVRATPSQESPIGKRHREKARSPTVSAPLSATSVRAKRPRRQAAVAAIMSSAQLEDSPMDSVDVDDTVAKGQDELETYHDVAESDDEHIYDGTETTANENEKSTNAVEREQESEGTETLTSSHVTTSVGVADKTEQGRATRSRRLAPVRQSTGGESSIPTSISVARGSQRASRGATRAAPAAAARSQRGTRKLPTADHRKSIANNFFAQMMNPGFKPPVLKKR